MRDYRINISSTSSIDLGDKKQLNKTLTELKNNFQVGSIINATVAEITSNGDAILATNNQYFLMQGYNDLQKGDKLDVNIKAIIGDAIRGEIISGEESGATVKLRTLPSSVTEYKEKNNAVASVDLSAIGELVQAESGAISARVTYLNMDKLKNNQLIYESMDRGEVEGEITLELQIDKKQNPIKLLPNQIKAVEIDNMDSSKRLFKTEFAIIEIDRSNLRAGRDIVFTILAINGSKVMVPTLDALVKDLVLYINSNIKAVRSLQNSIEDNAPENFGVSEVNKILSDDEHMLEIALTNSEKNLSFLNLLSKNYSQAVKWLTESNSLIGNQYYSYPIKYETDDYEKYQENNMLIKQEGEYKSEFIVEIDLPFLGEIRIKAVVKKNANLMVSNFDLDIQFTNSNLQYMQGDIEEIFLHNNSTNKIAGDVKFKKVNDFSPHSKASVANT